MPLAIGQATKGANASTTSQVTGNVNTQATGSLIVAAEIFNVTQTFSTVADNKSNSYTILGAQQGLAAGNGLARFYYKENAAGGTSHNLTFTNTGTASAITDFMAEATGVLTASALDGAVQQVNDAATPFTLSITPSAGNRIIFAFLAGDSGSNPATHAEANGFTIISTADETNGASFWTGCLAYKILLCDGVTAVNVSFTETGGTSVAVFLAAFKEAPSTSSVGANLSVGPARGPGKRQRRRGTQSFTSSTTANVFTQACDGVLSFVGALQKQTNKQVAGGLSFVGALQKQTNKVLAGVLSFGGALQKQTNKGLAGVLSFVGGLQKQTNKAFAGVLSFSGALASQAVFTKATTAGLSFGGALQKQTNKVLAGAIGFGGALQKQTNKVLAGGLSFAGALLRNFTTQKILSGILSFAGALATIFTPGPGGAGRFFIKKRARRDRRNPP